MAVFSRRTTTPTDSGRGAVRPSQPPYRVRTRGRSDTTTNDDSSERYDKSPAQVALRWLVQQDGVVAIPKASSREHLAANLEVFDFALSDAEMARIDDLQPSLRTKLYNFMPRIGRSIPV